MVELLYYIEELEERLHRSLQGSMTDPSWMHQVYLSFQQRKELFNDCYEIIKKIKNIVEKQIEELSV